MNLLGIKEPRRRALRLCAVDWFKTVDGGLSQGRCFHLLASVIVWRSCTTSFRSLQPRQHLTLLTYIHRRAAQRPTLYGLPFSFLTFVWESGVPPHIQEPSGTPRLVVISLITPSDIYVVVVWLTVES